MLRRRRSEIRKTLRQGMYTLSHHRERREQEDPDVVLQLVSSVRMSERGQKAARELAWTLMQSALEAKLTEITPRFRPGLSEADRSNILTDLRLATANTIGSGSQQEAGPSTGQSP